MIKKYCLCCLNELGDEEKGLDFHKKCLKKFFGTGQAPQIELNDDVLEVLAEKSSAMGVSVAGVQKKLSLHLLSKKNEQPRLTLIGFPQGYILKPQSADYQYLPETEQITMVMAEKVGVQVVPHSFIYISDHSLSYITKRIDRLENGDKIHMEDFCQLSGRLTEDKYKGSYEQCAKIIQKYSARPGIDLTDFFYRLLFCFVTGNSDMHLKNFSLIHNQQSGEWELARAYDLLPVNILMPSDKEETALTMNGKKSRLTRKDFLIFAQNIKIPLKAAEKMIERLVSKKDVLLEVAKSPFISDELQTNFCSLIEERCGRLMKD